MGAMPRSEVPAAPVTSFLGPFRSSPRQPIRRSRPGVLPPWSVFPGLRDQDAPHILSIDAWRLQIGVTAQGQQRHDYNTSCYDTRRDLPTPVTPRRLTLLALLRWISPALLLGILVLPGTARYSASANGSTPTASAAATPGTTTTPVPESLPPAHNVVLIVIDAGRPSYLKLTALPHIAALIRDGVTYSRAWVGQLNSSTPDVHVTFGTGTLPRENGYMGFGWATPATRQQVDFRNLVETGAIDRQLRSLPQPSITMRLRQYYPNAISIAASGHK